MMSRELHVRSHLSPIEHWRHLIEILALVAAAVWAIYVFVYQERIKPASEPPSFQSQITVRREVLSAKKEYVEVEIDLNNTSHTLASLAGMTVNVYGRSMSSTSSERIESPLGGITELNRTLVLSPPTLLYSFYDTWSAFGAPASKVGVIAAGHDFRERIAFGVEPHSFDMVKVTYEVCFSRPGKEQWIVHRVQDADGAYHFAGIGPPAPANLFCGGQRRGEYFPI